MNAFEKINIAILLATVSYIIAVNDLLARVDDIEPATRWIITVLTSVGLFRLLFVFVFWAIKRSDTLLAIYHRERFLKGLWTYRYEVDGKEHLGLWRVTQDLASISVTGYGIDVRGQGFSERAGAFVTEALIRFLVQLRLPRIGAASVAAGLCAS